MVVDLSHCTLTFIFWACLKLYVSLLEFFSLVVCIVGVVGVVMMSSSGSCFVRYSEKKLISDYMMYRMYCGVFW